PPAPDQLKFALAFAVTVISPEFDNRQIGRQESLAGILHESEKPLYIALQIIEEDPAHAPRFVTVFDEEVFVAPLLEAGVIIGVVFVACLFERAMEMARVFTKRVIGGQIGAAAKPSRVAFFEIPEVRMNRRRVGIARV